MTTIIIIPYRNREQHLKYFIDNSAPLLKKHIENMKIVIVEQMEGKPFNRGKLLNVVFKEYEDECKYIITHDVDINPKKKAILEFYTGEVDDNVFKGILTSTCDTLAPIFKTNIKNLFKINGFPNNIWGWGVEDKAIQNRVELYNFKIDKNLKNPIDKVGANNEVFQSYFKAFNDINDRDRTFEKQHYQIHYNKWNILSNIEKEKFITGNGLDSLTYKLVKKEIIEEGVIEKIIVDI
jgi:hypothetical protein